MVRGGKGSPAHSAGGSSFEVSIQCSLLSAPQVLKQLRHLDYIDSIGETVHFDENADMWGNYTIINWHRSTEDAVSVVFEEIGYYNMHVKKGSKLYIDETKILWNGHSTEVIHVLSLSFSFSFSLCPSLSLSLSLSLIYIRGCKLTINQNNNYNFIIIHFVTSSFKAHLQSF